MNPRGESLLSVWARRAVTFPVYLFLFALTFVTAPLWAAAGLAWDALTGTYRTPPRSRALAFFALYLACEAAGLFAAAGLWLVTLGGRAVGTTRWIGLNAALQRRWAAALFFGSRRLFSMEVSTEGLALSDEAPFLLFARHASVADTVLAAVFVANPRHLLLRYVLKRELLWDPCLDVVGRRLPNAFVRRRGPGLDAEVAAIAALAAKGEGELARIAARFRNVLPPRLRGPLALLDEAKGADLVLLEHTGFEGAATFPEFWRGDLVGRTLHIRLRRFPASTIPAEGRGRWLFERWAEMDDWISGAKAAGPAGRSDS